MNDAERTEAQTVTFANGLSLVYVRRDTVAEFFGVVARVGSRDEGDTQHGLAHFVEHTIFKGTSNRRASSIINCMENVGGELNAYTTKEETYVYSIFPSGNLSRSVRLIADLVINSVFPDDELDKEREVVGEEIDSYLDTPSEAVFDDFEDLMFDGSTLGHNILGDKKSLEGFDSSECRGFLRRYYVPSNMVVFYLGAEPLSKVEAMVRQRFENLRGGSVVEHHGDFAARQCFAQAKGDGDNHQAHTVMGATVPSLYSPDRYAYALINNILGGPGMNSRLNVALRERRGLVYSVESSIASYSDCGLLTIYYGCNPEDNARCRRLVETELRRMCDTPMTKIALERAKRQYIGQMTVASASAEQTILSAARSMLFRGRIIPAGEVIEKIKAVTPEGILAAASRLSPDAFSSLTLC